MSKVFLSRRAWLVIMVVSGFFCHQLAKVAGSERYDVTGPPEVRYVPGEVLVRFAPKANGVQRTTAEKNQVLSSLGGGTVEYEFWLVPGGSLVKLPPQMSVETAVQVFNKAEGIIYAHPNSELTPLSTIPNDPRFGDLWGMTQIDAPEAWDYSTGSSDIIVAVIDSGVDYTHPDLAGNMWVNADEIPGNGIDDDGNGYVDDIYGYDFYYHPVDHPRDPDPMDEYGHGTKMAGILGAVGNNNEGVVGVCWNVRIMALKFAGSHGMGNTGDTVLALQYAVVNGADVVNYSYGSTWTEQMPFLEDAIEQAGNLGLLFVAGAGNSNQDNDVSPSFYPASCDCNNIIAVLVTTRDDSRWYEDQYNASNYGLTTVDLGAPGPGILTCRWGGGYDYIDKTSAATAHVTGACALLWSINPGLSHLHLKQILLANVDKIGALSSYCVTAGRLNLYKAAACADAVGAPVFNIKNGSGEIVAWFDDLGNLILLGNLTQNTTPSPSNDKDEFRVQNATGDVAMIDTTNGNMTIQGSLHEQQGALQNPPSDDFIIKDSNGNIVAYINLSGHLYLKAKLYKSQ